MPIHYDYIKHFLGLKEGFEASGYVPCSKGVPLGESGVTIGKGVDLGQQTPCGLLAMGVTPDIVEKLRPYFGAKKMAAVNLLKERPLKLSVEEATFLSNKVSDSYIHATEKRFDKYAGMRGAFQNAPQQIQAVAVSLEYQRGPAWAKPFLNALANDAVATCATMLDCETEYATRRKSEARLLREVL